MTAVIDAGSSAIIVAALALAGTVATAWITRGEIKSRVGTPNGHGDVVQMAERLLAGQTGQDIRHAKTEARLSELHEDLLAFRGEVLREVGDATRMLSVHGKRLDVIESTCSALSALPADDEDEDTDKAP